MHSNGHSLQKYLSGITEYTFQTQLGVADPPLVDYLARLLSRFVRQDQAFPVRDPSGKRLTNLASMLGEAQRRVGEARRTVHKQIGDFTLFWAGVFPEALAQLQATGQGDCLQEYRTLGKRAYAIAAALPAPEAEASEGEIIVRLAHDYDLCLYGLGEVRREWESLPPASAPEVWGE